MIQAEVRPPVRRRGTMRIAANQPERVTMICPELSCRRAISAPAAARGKTVRCPYCGSTFRVPPGEAGPSAEGAAAASEPA